MSGAVAFDENGRDANGFACCSVCGYPFRGMVCDNPACDANPSVPEEAKAKRRADYERKVAEEAERERWRVLKRRAGGW